MASTDAKPIPQKNVAYRLTFPIFDNDGDLVTGAAGLDSEVSKDGATFADCTNEATEIPTSSGMYYLDLTATEMNADTVAVIIKTTTTDAKTTPIVMYPEEAGDIRVNATQIGSQTASAAATVTFNAEVGASATAMNAFEDAFDGTGYAFTGCTVPWNSSWDAEVQSECTDALNAYDPPTNAEMEARTLAAASYFDPAADTVANVTTVGTCTTNTDMVSEPPTAAAVADAVWDEDIIAAHNTADTAGDILGDNLNAPVGTVDTVVDGIKAVTDLLPDAGALTSIAQASALTTVDNEVGAIQTDLDNATDGLGALKALIDTMQTDVTAILADTGNLNDTAISELGVGVPAAEPTLRNAVMLLYMMARNKLAVKTSTTTDAMEVYNDAGTAICHKDVTDNDSDYTEAEMQSGATS